MSAKFREPVLAPVSHDDFVADVGALCGVLAAGGWEPDLLVGVARGGLAPAVYLSHLSGVPMVALTPGDAAAAAALAARAGAGSKLLLLDDINDSGGTLAAITADLARAGADASLIRTAVLIDNVRSAMRVDYRARTIDRATDKRWFVFPWEAMSRRETLLAAAREVPERLG